MTSTATFEKKTILEMESTVTVYAIISVKRLELRTTKTNISNNAYTPTLNTIVNMACTMDTADKLVQLL